MPQPSYAPPDPLADLLRRSPLSPAMRASIWDTFDQAADEDDLAQRLSGLQIPKQVKADLWDMKMSRRAQQPEPATAEEPSPAAGTTQPAGFDMDVALRRSGLPQLIELGKGAAKELATQGMRGGELLRKIPGVNAVSDLFPSVEVDARPTNTAQRVGGGLLNVAQVVAPAKAVTSLGVKAAEAVAPTLSRVVGQTAANVLPRAAVEGAAGAGLAGLQGADPTTGGALAAAIPVAGSVASGVAPRLTASLREMAEHKVVQGLGPTKERFKAMAERVAPGVLARRLGGSREALKEQSAAMVKEIGPQIDDAIQAAASKQIGTAPIVDALEASKAPYKTTRQMTATDLAQNPILARSAREVSPGVFEADVVLDARPLKQIDDLQQVIRRLGDEARVDQLVAVRRAWDNVVAQAGGYAQRAPGAIGVPLKDQSEAFVKREGSKAIRKLLDAEVPDLASINKEYSFWKSLDDVLGQTLKRTKPQGPGLGQMAAQGTGAIVGAVLGTAAAGPMEGAAAGFALGKASQMAQAAFASPRWKFVSAGLRDRLADAIAAGDISQIATVFGRISANRATAATSP